MGALKFKSFLAPAPVGVASLLMVVSALSACNSSKMFGDLHPSETLTKGYVIDQQHLF
ncbi:MAG: outer membrane assembly protein BamE, partial [Mesorhizobium sp.]